MYSVLSIIDIYISYTLIDKIDKLTVMIAGIFLLKNAAGNYFIPNEPNQHK
ncbi:hypothetical protein BH11BAC5_BH11BAC5_48810 [soil metagenome]|jgi:hypothetical protein